MRRTRSNSVQQGKVPNQRLRSPRSVVASALMGVLALGAGAASLQPTAARAELAWYKGDLHSHSTYSDGDSPVGDLVAEAERVGLDYYVVTDHDSSMGGATPHWFDPDYQSDKLILLYGIEWTNRNGHANIWAAAPFDYRPMWSANLLNDPWAAAQAAHEQGALFSINHPTNYACCPWVPEDGMNDAVEVWNSFHRTATWDYGATHYYWESALMDGMAITAVGGSDLHYLNTPNSKVFTVGNPTTWVLSDSATPAGILAGIKAGRASVSYGPDAARVELWADADEDGVFETGMGATIPEGHAALQVRVGENLTGALAPATPPKKGSKARKSAVNAGLIQPIPLDLARGFFGDSLSPVALSQLSTLLQPTACGPSYMVGLYEGNQLVSSVKVACGARWETAVNAQLYSFYRVEVLGAVKTNPGMHVVYGNYVGLSNPIRVQ